MSLKRLARELEETARQTGEMAAEINAAMHSLGQAAPGAEDMRQKAMQRIVIALQAQDRIEQRCRNLAEAVNNLVESDKDIDHPRFDEIWSSLHLDELAIPEMSGIAARVDSGECELF
jgi:methyl-accepting chemotaxis protein